MNPVSLLKDRVGSEEADPTHTYLHTDAKTPSLIPFRNTACGQYKPQTIKTYPDFHSKSECLLNSVFHSGSNMAAHLHIKYSFLAATVDDCT